MYCGRATRADGDDANKKYDVTVVFTIDLSSVNTAESVSQTLTFEVNFPGVVGTPPPPELIDVKYPEEVANTSYTYKTWSERVVAPDNVHVAWTSLNMA